MIARAAMLGIPAVAITLTAAVLLGPGATRPALGARVYGATAPPPAKVALRVVTLTSLFGVEEVAAAGDLALDENGNEVWSGKSASLGVAEAFFRANSSQPEIAVRSGQRLLARGKLDLSKPHPLAIEGVRPLEGPTRGELEVLVSARVIPFAVSFSGTLFVDVNEPGGGPIEAEVKISAPGATVTSGASEKLRKTFAIVPQFHVVNLEVDATAKDRSGHWEGNLPIVPGAMGLEATPDGRLRVVAPAPRERVFVSFWSPEGRIAGRVLTLLPEEKGQIQSEPFDVAASAPGSAAVTLSSDPLEQGSGTVTWPLASGRATPPELALLLDGMPRAIADESARAWRVRRWGLLVLAAAALAEICLVLARSRKAQAALEAHFVETSDEEPADALRAADSPAGYYALASASLIAGAFAIVAALAAFR